MYDSLTEKNIGPSSASHSPSTAVVHCMYSFDVMMSSWYVQKSGVYPSPKSAELGCRLHGMPVSMLTYSPMPLRRAAL